MGGRLVKDLMNKNVATVQQEGAFHLFDEGIRIVERARSRGITMRLIGGIAVMQHCPVSYKTYGFLRAPPKDLDFATYSRFWNRVPNLFRDLHYSPDKPTMTYFGRSRHIYYNEKRDVVDVIFDEANMNHTIDFRGQLELDYPTAPLAILLLQKLQTVQMSRKDIIDVIFILLEHDIKAVDEETIDGDYVSRILSYDWSPYYTIMSNLTKIKSMIEAEKYPLMKQANTIILDQISKLSRRIEGWPKSLKWKLRAMVGPRLRWYLDAEEIVR